MTNRLSLTFIATILSAGFAASSANASVKLGMGIDQGLGMNLKFDNTVNLFAGNDGMALDYHFARGSLSSSAPLGWYVGVGGYYEWNDNFGMRLPVGLDWSFASNWNLTAQFSPELQVHHKTKFKFGAGLGVSYQF
ncbi:hypothetical protein [Vibrio superstes]|uniref:Outer membrane protein beta-barrel domain-containing protein n=1 Tax=Vibrio superstes NBRC 103154 TaxID=1219062 RepID=A0A511QQA7_9VIBR|nr:hypothetical protein [Vibrio superstes]GEM79528.1 hypothetical protein VSU01S_17730 [Vibrio superstes NBRC 103154]